jgi:hypothetical protein
MTNVIKVAAVPGLAVFVEGWLDDPNSTEDFYWPWYRVCTAPGCVPHSGVGCAACAGCGLIDVLPLSVPAARDALVRAFAAGVFPCWKCSAKYLNGHPHCGGCGGTGRLSANQSMFRDNPDALAKSVRLVLSGREPLRGVLGEWSDRPGSSVRPSAAHDEPWALVNHHGWVVQTSTGVVIARGKETGSAGKAAADAAARDLYWLDGGPFEEKA